MTTSTGFNDGDDDEPPPPPRPIMWCDEWPITDYVRGKLIEMRRTDLFVEWLVMLGGDDPRGALRRAVALSRRVDTLSCEACWWVADHRRLHEIKQSRKAKEEPN